mgnify:FL=1
MLKMVFLPVQNNNLYLAVVASLMISFFYIGFKFPDIDLKFKSIGHRSIITHSPLLPLMLFILHETNMLWLVYAKKYDITRYFIIGLSLGIALHLLYDLRPKSFKGTALIKFPYIKKGLTINQSIYFMLISVIILLLISIYQVRTIFEIIIMSVIFLITVIVNRKTEKGFYTVVFLFLLIFCLGVYFKEYIAIIVNFIKRKFI